MSQVPVFRPRLMGQVGILPHPGVIPPQNLLLTLDSSWWGTGPRVAEFETLFAQVVSVDAGRCLMLNSCTAALHLAVKLYPDAERFLLPALTFVSTGLAPLYEGKQVVFIEVGDDLCINQGHALQMMRSERDVVIAVHLGGHVAKLDLLRASGCRIIEDCAHALGSYESEDEAWLHVGRDAGCFSFQATKGLPIGDGGMLVLPDLTRRGQAEAWAWCGISQSTWDRTDGQYRWAYSIEEVGYKYRANDIMASLALDQLPGLQRALEERSAIAAFYAEALAGLPWLRLPNPRPETRPSWQEYMVRTECRDELQTHLAERGVATTVHYYPIHMYPIFGEKQPLSFTEKVWQEILTVPCFAGMTRQEQERVIDGIRSFKP